MRRRLILLASCLLACWPAGLASADTLTTRDGKSLEGTAALANGKLAFTANGKTRTLGLDEVSDLVIAAPGSNPVSNASGNPGSKPVNPTAKPAPAWAGQDVGLVGAGGRERITGQGSPQERIVVHASGFGFRSGNAKKNRVAQDAFRFVCQPLEGDATIVARVYAGDGRAGLMIRDGLSPDAPFVMVSRSGDMAADEVVARAEKNALVNSLGQGTATVLGAAYLKLTRSGDKFVASESTDGKTWKTLGQTSVAMVGEKGVLIGLAASGRENNGLSQAIFDRIEITRDSTPAKGNKGNVGLARGVLTRAGSFLAGEVVAMEDKKITLRRPTGDPKTPTKDQMLLTADLARVVLRPITPEMARELSDKSSGVMLISGDWAEGELKRIGTGEVQVSSVVMGLMSFEVKNKLAVVSLAKPEPVAQAPTVELADGSRLRPKSLSVQGEMLVVEDVVFGTLNVPAREFRTLHRP